VFEYRRTPYLGLVYAGVIGFAVTQLIETPDRPLTLVQTMIFYVLSYLPGLGLAMLGDPAPHRAKAEYLKVDFYAPKEPGEEAACR
jgi:hypothetical protein